MQHLGVADGVGVTQPQLPAHGAEDSLEEWFKNTEGLRITSSEGSLEELNLVYVGSVCHYSEQDGHKPLCTPESGRAKRGTAENICK